MLPRGHHELRGIRGDTTGTMTVLAHAENDHSQGVLLLD